MKLNASHSDLCRFDLSEADQDNLKKVRGNIEDIYVKALEKGESINVPTATERQLEQRLAALRPPVL